MGRGAFARIAGFWQFLNELFASSMSVLSCVPYKLLLSLVTADNRRLNSRSASLAFVSCLRPPMRRARLEVAVVAILAASLFSQPAFVSPAVAIADPCAQTVHLTRVVPSPTESPPNDEPGLLDSEDPLEAFDYGDDESYEASLEPLTSPPRDGGLRIGKRWYACTLTINKVKTMKPKATGRWEPELCTIRYAQGGDRKSPFARSGSSKMSVWAGWRLERNK